MWCKAVLALIVGIGGVTQAAGANPVVDFLTGRMAESESDSTTQPANGRAATTQPATASAFPSAEEMAERIRQMKGSKYHKPKIAYFDLSGGVVERPADFSLFGDPTGQTLVSVVERITSAIDDNDITALLVTLSSNTMNLAQAQEVRNALRLAVEAEKKVFVYADTYDTISYTVATGASDICLMAGGEIMIPGIGIETLFARGLLDKLGIHADYVQIGEFKGADEQFTRTEPSEELANEMNKLMDGLFGQIVQGIADSRKVSTEQVIAMIDRAMLSPEAAKADGWIDHIVEIDGLRDLMDNHLEGNEVELVRNYGLQEDGNAIDISNPLALLASLNRSPRQSSSPQVALIYADGAIIDGSGGTSLTGGSIVGSDDIRSALRVVERDNKIKGLVIRIDSPGGSATASEAIWQAVRRVGQKKPVVVSIGSMAASGGYYLASASDHIFADETAIIGSIGVVGGKFVLTGLFDKIGLTTYSFSRGANSDLFSSSSHFSAGQREMVTVWMSRTYDQFVERVMTTREGKIENIDSVARGRVFIGTEALKLGMVDEIGGLSHAIDYIVEKAEIDGDYDLRILPAPRTLADLLRGGSDVMAPLSKPAVSAEFTALLSMMPQSFRRMVDQQVTMSQLLQDRPMVLMLPYGISVK